MGATLSGPIGPDRRAVRALWLIRLRWVAIAGQVAVIPPALTTGWLEADHLSIYLTLVAALAGFNLVLYFLHRKAEDYSTRGLAGQMSVDLFVLGSLLVMTGGVYNPMAPITLIHASLCPLIFRGAWSYTVGTLLLLLIGIISWLPHHPSALGTPVTDPSVQGMAHIIVTLLIWGLTTWLTASLRQGQSVIESLRVTQARQDRLRATGLLAAGFCHELATPLNIIGLRLGRLESHVPATNADLTAIRESLGHCEAVLQSMIDHRLDSDRLRFERLRPDLLAQEVADQWAIHQRPVVVESDTTVGEWFLPRLLLAQTLADLLDNAHQAMVAVLSDEPIILRTTRDGDRLRISVLDCGPGIPAAIRPHIGQPFVTTKRGGSGLGLYNANNFCVALGGALGVSDRESGGACVTLHLTNGASEITTT